MKRKCLLIVLLVVLLITPLRKGFGHNADSSKLAVSVNPMGLLFFGPAVNIGWKMDGKTMINIDVRRNSWGLLARKIRASDSTLFRFKGMGYAIGWTRFVKNIKEGFYYGAFLSMDIQNTKYLENSPYQWHEQTNSIGLLLNAGKRFKIGSQFYLNAGAVVGAAFLKYHWEYDDVFAGATDPEARTGNSFLPIGSLELALGMFLF